MTLRILIVVVTLWELPYLWWESWEIILFKMKSILVNNSKGRGKGTNHICIASSTNVKKGFLSMNLYVHSRWVCAYYILIIFEHLKLNFMHTCVMQKCHFNPNLVFQGIVVMSNILISLWCLTHAFFFSKHWYNI